MTFMKTSKVYLDKYTHISNKKKKAPTYDEQESPKNLRSSEPVFDALKHCMFCGSVCNVKRDTRNPARWREAYLCLSAEGTKTLNKKTILKRCSEKGDKQSDAILFRLLTVTDLAAGDFRYHKDCYSTFFSYTAMCSESKASHSDLPFQELLKVIESDVNQVWTSSSFVSQYSELSQSYNTHEWTKKWLIDKIRSHFGETLVTLSSFGHENMFVFPNFASGILKLIKSDDEDCLTEAITHVSKAISREFTDCSKKMQNDMYHIGLLDDIIELETSETLMKVLPSIHQSLSQGPQAHLINSIVFSCFTQSSTSLQCMLGGYFRHIPPVRSFEKLSKYGVTCSYDELKRLRTSSAKFSIQNLYYLNLPLNDSSVQITSRLEYYKWKSTNTQLRNDCD